LLTEFHLETGARREGALNLALDDLDERRSTVWLHEKFSKEREQPISPSLLARIKALARASCRAVRLGARGHGRSSRGNNERHREDEAIMVICVRYCLARSSAFVIASKHR
jgi:integrase